MSMLRRLVKLGLPLIHRGHRLARGMTLGVRGLVEDGEGRILLIEHTYLEGWHLPGGGVDRGETAEAALIRELAEEAGVRVTGPAALLSIHSQDAHFRGDHVLLYRVTAWEPCPATSRGEIARIGWFAPDALPDGTTRATRARIGEALSRGLADPAW